MTFFRRFLVGVFCACISLPAWSVADPACNIIQNFTSKSSADSFAKKDIITCHKSGKNGFDFEVTPIEHAIDFNNVEAVRAILQIAPSKASSMVHTNKQTILDYAVQGCAGDKRYRKQEIPREQKRLEIIKLLIENGADVNTVAYDSKATMLDLSRDKHKGDGNAENYDWTFCNQIETLLLKHGAKTYAELQGGGSSAEQYEVRRDQPEVINTQTSVATASVSISGTVVDAKTNESLVGVNIALMQSDGTTMINNAGCTTDLDGNFSASFNNIPQDAKMRVSYVGYEQQLLSLGQNVKIALQPTRFALKDVVVSAPICTDKVLAELKASKGEKAVGADGEAFCKPTECLEGYHFQEPEKVICVKDDDVVTPADTGTAEVPDNSKPPKPQIDQKAIDDAESAYSDAKANEQSLANRMLGGATMAATGIGGMQLAQGLAEQSVDAASEVDMQAYLATFTCKIGDKGGKSYKGGEKGIEVSGSNQLAPLYQQYVDLAADLKERKAALGMAPGIESAVVMDKANMGLYDDTGRGIENGTYASLYRASKGNENDAKKLSEQKNASQTRVKAGAIAAGAGVVGGIVGNAIINGDKDKVNEADCKKAGGTFKDNKCNCPGKKVYKDGKCQDAIGGDLKSKMEEAIDVNPNPKPDNDAANDDVATEGADETLSEDKIKECVDYINVNATVAGPFKEENCERLVIKVSDSLWLALTNEEAAALSPVWNWGCSADGEGNSIYIDGTQEYEKDACTTVENMKAFIANSKKSCDDYPDYELQNIVWMDRNVCVPKSWGPDALSEDKVDEVVPVVDEIATKCTDAGGTYAAGKCDCGEYKEYDEATAECKVVNPDKKRHTPCTEEDFASSKHTKNASEGWYDNKKYCVASKCSDGYKLVIQNNQSQGYCVKK